jgi:hypothetical protein
MTTVSGDRTAKEGLGGFISPRSKLFPNILFLNIFIIILKSNFYPLFKINKIYSLTSKILVLPMTVIQI